MDGLDDVDVATARLIRERDWAPEEPQEHAAVTSSVSLPPVKRVETVAPLPRAT
jgi:hypothetical protein